MGHAERPFTAKKPCRLPFSVRNVHLVANAALFLPEIATK
jgi:hypothetical protein